MSTGNGNGYHRKGTEQIDRLPPHSPECEQIVIGSILRNAADCLPMAIEILTSGTMAFYDLRHQTIYDCATELWNDRKSVDTLIVYQALKDRQLSEQVGGLGYLGALDDVTPGMLPMYLNVVQDKFLCRQMISACTEAVVQIYDYEGEPGEVIDSTERKILDVRRHQNKTLTPKITDLVKSAIDKIEEYHGRGGGVTGLSTGFIDLDKLTSGLQPAEMMVIAARPSMGKTSLAMNIADHVAVELNAPVGIFSLEMTAESLVLRMICSRARVNLRNIREGFLSERDFPKLTNAAGKINKAPIHIDDTKGLSVMQLRAKARRMQQQYGLKLLVVDYLQLLNDQRNDRRYESRQQEVANISNGLKCLAGELNIPVIVLSQLNRDVERDKKRKPRLSDLRESGAIENDADFIGLLYKSGHDDDEEADTDAVAVNLMIGKQRNGPANVDVELTFLKTYTRFESTAKIYGADVPQGKQQTISYNSPYPND